MNDEPADTQPPANAADVLAELVRVLVELRAQPKKPRGLGPCDVLTVPEAIAVLGMREPDAKRWLAEHELIREVAGRQRVIAGDLTEAIRNAGRKGPNARAVAPVRRLPLSSRL